MDNVSFICIIKRWKTGYFSGGQGMLEAWRLETHTLIQDLVMSSQVSQVRHNLWFPLHTQTFH